MPSRISPGWLEESRAPQPWVGGHGPGADPARGPARRPPSSGDSARHRAAGSDRSQQITREAPQASRVELAILLACVMILPFDDALPLGPISWGWVVFAALALFEVLRNTQRVIAVATSGPMLRMWLFLALALAFEASHASDSLLSWVSVVQMAVALGFVAVAIRDPRAMRVAMYGLVAAGVVVALISVNGNFGWLSRAEGSSAWEVTWERGEALRGTLIGRADINSAAGSAAIGATIAVGLAITTRARGARVLFGFLAAFIATGVMVTASRGAMVTLLVGASAGLLLSHRRWLRGLMVVGLLVAVAVLLVPRSAFSRFEEIQGGTGPYAREDPRADLWQATVDSAAGYLPLGVGVSDFFQEWGKANGFTKVNPETGAVEVVGTHNAFTQVLIWWGIPTLAALLWFLAHLISSVARRHAALDLRAVVLMAVAALLGQAMVAHTLQDKVYSIVLGMALGYVMWFEEPARLTDGALAGTDPGVAARR